MPILPAELPTELTDKYSVENNALVRVAKPDPRDKIEVEVGDSKVPGDFLPQLKIMRWDNEVNFSVRLIESETGLATIGFDKEKITWRKGKIDVEYYDYENGHKMVWHLKEKPATNKLEFSIRAKGLSFLRQPPLTEEFQNGYSEEFKKEIVVSETQVKDLEGKVLVERPEDIVDSIAIYCSENKANLIGGKLYRAGKFGHIKRIKIIDADGWEVWGKLNIDIYDKEKGIGTYLVEIPQNFLDNAVYPIKSNENFGYETVGTSSYYGSQDFILVSGTTYTPASAGTGVSMSIYAKVLSGTKNAQMALYDDASPSNLITNGYTPTVVIGTTPDWYSGNFGSPPAITAIAHYLAFNWQTSPVGSYGVAYDVDIVDQKYKEETFGSWPATISWTVWTGVKRKYSIYCTYTPAGVPPVVTTQAVDNIEKTTAKGHGTIVS